MSLLNTGLSGLNAAQVGLQTAGHNIANASTPGFNRQQIVQTTNTSLGGSAGMIGQGVNVASVRRVYDDLLFGQSLQAQSQSSQLDSYYSQISQINRMFGEPNSGLSPALAGFFSSVQDLANNPDSVPSRQQLLSSGQALAARFQSLDQRFAQMGGDLNTQIDSSVTEINSLAQQIAKLNITIREIEGDHGQPANDLLDQRDGLLTRLNQEIGTTTVKDSDGSLSVFIGVGQPLVAGDQAMKLTTTTSPTNLSRSVVGYAADGRSSMIADSSLQGGKLGGYLAFRANTLDNAQNALGRIATGLAKTFNDQHRLGQDLNGVAGGDFFNVANPRVIPNHGNMSPNATINATIGDVSELTTSDYEFSYDGTNSTLKRLSDHVSVSVVGQPSIANPLNFDGVSISGVSNLSNGDRFLIQPTHNGARDFSVAISDTAKIAAAAPVRTNAALANMGSGVISAGTVNSFNNKVVIKFNDPPTTYDAVDSTTGAKLAKDIPYTSGSDISFNGWNVKISDGSGAPVQNDTFTIERGVTFTNSGSASIGATNLNSPSVDPFLGNTVKIVFDNPPSTFHLEDGFGAPISEPDIHGSPPLDFTSGRTNLISVNGWTVEIAGSPAAGDSFMVSSNTGGAADNRNALRLGGLQTENTLNGGTSSYQSNYGQLVSEVGNKTRELEATSKAQSSMVTQIQQSQQSMSGVNLDEEATSLMRYQQAYQASAKVIQLANTLWQTLLDIR